MISTSGLLIEFNYRNYKGEISRRRVNVHTVEFGSNEWHPPEPQWLMQAIDLDKNEQRAFAMKDMWKVTRIERESYNPFSPVVETMQRKS